MLAIEGIAISEKARAQIKAGILGYRRIARISITIDTIADGYAYCTASQTAPAPDGQILTRDEITERAEDCLAPMAEEGIFPLITIMVFGEEKPKAKHRYVQNGKEHGLIFRTIAPRALYRVKSREDVATLHLEEPDMQEKVNKNAVKAYAWQRGRARGFVG